VTLLLLPLSPSPSLRSPFAPCYRSSLVALLLYFVSLQGGINSVALSGR
jgi:hypothetical protein